MFALFLIQKSITESMHFITSMAITADTTIFGTAWNVHSRITFTQTSCYSIDLPLHMRIYWHSEYTDISRTSVLRHGLASSRLKQVPVPPEPVSRGTLASSAAPHLLSPAPSVYNCSTRTPSPIPALVARCVVTPVPPPPRPPFILPAAATNVTVALER